MERLTYRDAKGEAWYSDKGTEADRLHFIADIEDIMGDECNLSRLIELVTAYKEGRYIIMRYAEQKGVARLLELSEADRDGRCGIPPVKLHQTIYRVFDGKIIKETVCKAIWEPFIPRPRWKVWVMGSGLPYYWNDCIGKTVFLTCEAAEAAMKARDGK